MITTSGLKKVVDIRDKGYNHAKRFGSVAPLTLPSKGLGRKPGKIYQQFNTFFCTAFATAAASSYQEKLTLSPEWQTAKTGQVDGAPIFTGTDLRSALKSAILFGSIPYEDSPFTLEKDGEDKVARWQNYPANLTSNALVHAKQDFYDVKNGKYDVFDNIRSALYLANEENGVAIVGTPWYQSFNDPGPKGLVFMPPVGEKTYLAHAWVIYDFDDDYLYAQLSSGESLGNKGTLKFDRKTINYIFRENWTCAFILRDRKSDPAWRDQAYRIILGMLWRISNQLKLIA